MQKLSLIFIFSITVFSFAHSAELEDGYYNEYFLGSKSGGPWLHDNLAKRLKIMTKGKSLKVFCIKGPDNTITTGVEVEQYRKNNPKSEILKKCKGSGWVYVGPYSTFKLAEDNYTYYSGAMLHTIPSNILLCESLMCRVINEQPNK